MHATRMRDTAFKRSLGKMPVGTEVEFEGPFGSYTLHNDAKKAAVFLVGGIGITPVRSIVLDAHERALPHQLIVFYSNRRPEDAPFLKELSELAHKMPTFKFVPTMTDIKNSKVEWNGETGYVTQEMVERYVVNLKSAVFYLDGPMAMVNAMRALLEKAGVDSDYIKTEEFPGY
jgi:ferredoxin-NADP reductase